jgi:hypothetical protein
MLKVDHAKDRRTRLKVGNGGRLYCKPRSTTDKKKKKC